MLLVYVRLYPKLNSHSWLLISLILHRARRPTLCSDLGHDRLIDHAHPHKLHDRCNVHYDEFRRILYNHHKSIASTLQQQASWKYDARIFRHPTLSAFCCCGVERGKCGLCIRLTGVQEQHYKTGKRLHILHICPVNSNRSTGLHVYAHSLVKLWEHAAGQVELSMHISTKQNMDAINLNVSGMWLSIAKVTCPCQVHGCVCLLCFCATASFSNPYVTSINCGLHFHGLTSYEQLNSFGAKRQKKLDPGFDSQGWRFFFLRARL